MEMIFTSPRGQQIIFDDHTHDEEFRTIWVEMCPHHHNMYRHILGNRCDDKGTAQGICSVKGCDREADYYVDFKEYELS